MNIPAEYRLPLMIAGGLHLLVLILLTFNLALPNHAKQLEIIAAAPEEPVITATAVNRTEVAAEVQRLERAEKSRQEKIEAEQQKIRVEKAQMEKQREQAQLELAQVQHQKEELAKKAAIEKKHLEELKHKQEEERKKEEVRKKEQAKKEELAKKAEQERKAEEIKKVAKEAEKKRAAELAAKQRAEEEKQMQKKLAAEEQALQSQEGERVTTEVGRYQALIMQKIRQNWSVQGSFRPNIQGKLRVRLAPGGAVIDVQVMKSSGDEVFDRSAINAAYRASPLPVSGDQKVFNELRDIIWTYKQADMLSSN